MFPLLATNRTIREHNNYLHLKDGFITLIHAALPANTTGTSSESLIGADVTQKRRVSRSSWTVMTRASSSVHAGFHTSSHSSAPSSLTRTHLIVVSKFIFDEVRQSGATVRPWGMRANTAGPCCSVVNLLLARLPGNSSSVCMQCMDESSDTTGRRKKKKNTQTLPPGTHSRTVMSGRGRLQVIRRDGWRSDERTAVTCSRAASHFLNGKQTPS